MNLVRFVLAVDVERCQLKCHLMIPKVCGRPTNLINLSIKKMPRVFGGNIMFSIFSYKFL